MRIDDLRRYQKLVWLRDYASLWLARVDEASNEVNTFWFAVIGISTSASALKSYGQTEYVIPGIIAFVAAGVFYVWAYDKFRFMREKSQQKAVRKTNYVNPRAVINHAVRARQLERAVELINERTDPDGEIDDVTYDLLSEFYKGIDLSRVDGYDFSHE